MENDDLEEWYEGSGPGVSPETKREPTVVRAVRTDLAEINSCINRETQLKESLQERLREAELNIKLLERDKAELVGFLEDNGYEAEPKPGTIPSGPESNVDQDSGKDQTKKGRKLKLREKE